MTLTVAVTAFSLTLAVVGILFAFAMQRYSDHPRLRHWCGIGIYGCVACLVCLWSTVLLIWIGMPLPRSAIAVVGFIVFLSALLWPQIESVVGYRPQEAAPASPSPVPVDYAVALHLLYRDHQFRIYNDGRTNLYLCGTHLGDGPRLVDDDDCRIIAPSPLAFYFLRADAFERESREKIREGASGQAPLTLFLRNELRDKYIARFMLIVRHLQGGMIDVDTQMVGLDRTDWQP